MSDNVSIPRDAAAELARRLRMDFCNGGADPCDCSAARAADLLDPPPPLRVEVARAWCSAVYGQFSGSAKNPASHQLDAADAVLAVVRAHYAAEVEALCQVTCASIDDLAASGCYVADYRQKVLALFAEVSP